MYSHYKFLRSILPFFCAAVLWQALITIIATVISHSFHAANPVTPSIFTFDYMLHWDGQWYLSIVNGSYADPTSFSPAFFPLFPLILWGLRIVTFGLIDLTVVSLVMNTTLLAISLLMLSKISTILLPKLNYWILPFIFLLSPAAVFQNFFYTEALFCALAFTAYYLSLRRKWEFMAIILLFVTATRLPGVLIVGLCGLEYFRFHSWSIKSAILDRNFLWFFITPIGLATYAIFLHYVRGDMLAMFHSQRLWSYHQFNPNILETYYNSIRTIADNLVGPNEIGYVLVVSQLLPLLSITLAFIASLYFLVRRINIPLGIYGIVAAIFFSLNSNVVSVHRYMLAVITIHVALLYIYQSERSFAKPLFYASLYVSVMLQSILLFLFSNNYFAG